MFLPKLILISSFVLFTGAFSFAQDIAPCGTPPFKSDWLKKYQKTPNTYAKGSDTTLYVPLTLHILGTDAGESYFPILNIMESFCELNEDFAPSNIQFFIEGEFRYLNNSAWLNHTEIATGYEMMITNNVPNTINCYIVAVAAGSGGYNLPSANSIALLRSNIGIGTHTWAHEIGHNLSIQHPFLGWEGNPYVYDQPTPTEVYYNYTSFKPVFYTDTIIIDTAQVEYVARTNCYEAADGFCDTPPDYLSGGWQCNSDTLSMQLQKDPDSVDFRSDGTNIMSYADFTCDARHFTPEQTAAMRANLLDEKPGYLYNQNSQNALITDAPVLVAPIGNEQVPVNAVHLSWENVPNATHYFYEVNRLSNFSSAFVIVSGIVEGTSVEIEDLLLNTTYYWRIVPFNQGNTCALPSEGESFSTDEAVGVQEIDGMEALNIYPNLLAAGQSLHIELTSNQSLHIQANLYNMKGQLIQPLFETNTNGSFTTSIEINDIPAGMYLISIQSNGNVFYQKIIIT